MHRLGVDFGGVITDRNNEYTDTSFFSDNFLDTTATEGSIEALTRLNREGPFKQSIWLVSKCGPKIQSRTEQWLRHNKFHDITGIPPENVHFTPKRIGKLAIAQNLELTHFVDDRLQILGYLIDTVPNLYLFDPIEDEMHAHRKSLPHVTVVQNWQTLEGLLTSQEA